MKHYYSKLPHSIEDLIIDFVYSREVHISKQKVLHELHISDFLKHIATMYRRIRVYQLVATIHT